MAGSTTMSVVGQSNCTGSTDLNRATAVGDAKRWLLQKVCGSVPPGASLDDVYLDNVTLQKKACPQPNEFMFRATINASQGLQDMIAGYCKIMTLKNNSKAEEAGTQATSGGPVQLQ